MLAMLDGLVRRLVHTDNFSSEYDIAESIIDIVAIINHAGATHFQKELNGLNPGDSVSSIHSFFAFDGIQIAIVKIKNR